MKARKIWTWSLMALGGFLFGFDTAVISGAEQAIQELWVTEATALLGTFVGAVLGGPVGDRLGRKRALAVIGALYLLSALESALTASWGAIVAFRLLGGLGVGWVVSQKLDAVMTFLSLSEI